MRVGRQGLKMHTDESVPENRSSRSSTLTLSSPQFVASRHASPGDPGSPRCQCACGHAWDPTGKEPSETVPGEKKKTLSSGKKHHPLTKKPKKKVKINRGAGEEEQDGRGLISEGEANDSVCVLMRRTEEWRLVIRTLNVSARTTLRLRPLLPMALAWAWKARDTSKR